MPKKIKPCESVQFPMKAVIICDNLAFAANAASILARVGRQAAVNVRWTTKTWPMNALSESALAEQALVETLDAHLILFPEGQAQTLPPWVFDWLGSWAARRIVQDAALGVIKDGNTIGGGTVACPALADFAQKLGLSCIVDKEPAGKNSMRLPVRFPQERIMALHVPQTNSVTLAMPCSHRNFGINE